MAYVPYTPATIAITAIILYITYCILWTVYDVFLGGLSKIPGPKLAAATRLVSAYHRIRGNGELWMFDLHKKYGDIVRHTPTEVSLASGHEWEPIYGYGTGSRIKKAAMHKDAVWYDRHGDTSMLVSNDDDHPRHRKTFSYAFSEKALMQQEPIIQQYIDELISVLRQSMTGPGIDVTKYYNFTTFDIMSDLMFGHPLGCLQNSAYTAWVAVVFDSLKVVPFSIELNYRPLLKKIVMAMLPKSIKDMRDSHRQHSVDRVDIRLADHNPRPDILGLVERTELKEDQKLEMHEIYSNAQLIMLAGTETTATLLSGVTYYLLTNPDKYSKVKREVRSAFSTSQDITANKVLRLSYLNCCLQEALRLYPPVPIGLPRMVGKGGKDVAGYHLPQGASISIHQYSTYHNPKNFASPESFIPERWLKEGSPAEFANDNRACVQPFSVGPRNCLGMSLAWLEMRLVLAKVIYNFDLTLCEASSNWLEQKQYLLWEKKPLNVTLQPADLSYT